MNYRVNRFSAGELTKITKNIMNTLVPPAEQQGYYYPVTGSRVQKEEKAPVMEQKERNSFPGENSGTNQVSGTADSGKLTMSDNNISGKSSDSGIDLQEAIVWSEILGKPLSKRRKRRYYGD